MGAIGGCQLGFADTVFCALLIACPDWEKSHSLRTASPDALCAEAISIAIVNHHIPVGFREKTHTVFIPYLRLGLIPAVAVFLLEVSLAQPVDDLLASETANPGCNQINQCNRGDVTRRKRQAVDRNDDELIGEARERRQRRVGDSDAIGTFLIGPLDALDCHAKAAAKADSDGD